MSGKDDLDRSKDSAEAEAGSVDSPVGSCKDWVGLKAHYDDDWQTPVTKQSVRIEVNGGVVADGPMNKSLSTFSLQDGEPDESIVDQLSKYRVNGVDPGSAKVCLIPEVAETRALENEIYASLNTFEATVKQQVGTYLTAWEDKGWRTVPDAYSRGVDKGMTAWVDGEKEFWSGLGSAIESAADSTWTWATDGGLLATAVFLNPFTAPSRINAYLFEQISEFWQRREEIMRLARAFANGAANEIEQALSALKTLPGEVGEIITSLVQYGKEWAQNMIEVAKKTQVFQRALKTIMSVLMMLTPNFWAEIAGTASGYIIPEVVITIIIILIGALCTAAGATAIAARIAKYGSKIKKAWEMLGKAGKVLASVYDELKALFSKIGELSKKLRKKRSSDVVDGSTGTDVPIVRKVRPRLSVKKGPVPGELDQKRIRELGVNHEQGGKLDLAEGTAGARYEAVNGRPLTQSDVEGIDLFDGDTPVSLKGPLMNKKTGEVLPINDRMVDGLGDAAVEDLKFNRATKEIVIDTFGMSDDQRQAIVKKMADALAETPDSKKYVTILE